MGEILQTHGSGPTLSLLATLGIPRAERRPSVVVEKETPGCRHPRPFSSRKRGSDGFSKVLTGSHFLPDVMPIFTRPPLIPIKVEHCRAACCVFNLRAESPWLTRPVVEQMDITSLLDSAVGFFHEHTLWATLILVAAGAIIYWKPKDVIKVALAGLTLCAIIFIVSSLVDLASTGMDQARKFTNTPDVKVE